VDSWYGAGGVDWEKKKHSPLWLGKNLFIFQHLEVLEQYSERGYSVCGWRDASDG